MQMCSPKQTVGRVHKQERSHPDMTCHVVPVTTFTLNKMDFNKMFGLDGQQYKVWYKAVRALQAQLKKNDRDEDTGVLGMEHMGMLQEALRKEGCDLKQLKPDADQVAKNLINDLGEDVKKEMDENQFIAMMVR